jgi:hypothetical protein
MFFKSPYCPYNVCSRFSAQLYPVGIWLNRLSGLAVNVARNGALSYLKGKRKLSLFKAIQFPKISAINRVVLADYVLLRKRCTQFVFKDRL